MWGTAVKAVVKSRDVADEDFAVYCYGFADRLARTLGRNATMGITRLSSFLLVCTGVQIGWNGIGELLESVTLHLGLTSRSPFLH